MMKLYRDMDESERRAADREHARQLRINKEFTEDAMEWYDNLPRWRRKEIQEYGFWG